MSNRSPLPIRWRWPLTALFVGWLFFVAGMFYVTQKPFSPADAPLLARALRAPFTFSAGAAGRTTRRVASSAASACKRAFVARCGA